jgi:hypothetical protein
LARQQVAAPASQADFMQLLLNIVIGIVMLAALGIVIAGFVNMARGGSGNVSQKLMRARVIAQAVAIALLMAALFFFGGNHGTPGS